MFDSQPNPLLDIRNREDIERLVNAFYERVRRDELLGFIFDEVARTDWESHLPKMYAFWETVLFGTGGYQGNPLVAHAKLVPLTEMGEKQFDRWRQLFKATVDEFFFGEKAAHIQRAAEDMANVIHARIHNVADARFDPERLSPEQRSRYARYRAANKGQENETLATADMGHQEARSGDQGTRVTLQG